MKGPDEFDNGSTDHERFETEVLAHERDADSRSIGDIERGDAHRLVNDLIYAGVVLPVPKERLLVFDSSGEAFESIV